MTTTMPTRTTRLILAAAAMLALSGCGSTSSSPAPTGTSSPTPAVSSAAAAASPSASGGPASSAPPVSSADPVVAGRATFELWARPQVAYGQWWRDLAPRLSPAGKQAYQYTDPSQIPTLRITGALTKAAKAPDLPGLSAMVYVPTDRGQFALFLTRTTSTSPWLLLRISFPPGLS